MRREPTLAEQKLWQRLRKQQLLRSRFRRQHALERFVVDFYCAQAQLAVEVDGPVHDYTPEEDAIRQSFLESLGLRLLRFTNEEVADCLGAVVARTEAALRERRNAPAT